MCHCSLLPPPENQRTEPLEYSADFRRLIRNGEAVEKLAGGCGAKGCDLAEWENRRAFLRKAFDGGGSVLDVGCGNAFLLRSLQEWCKADLNPHGFDPDSEIIAEALQIFPRHKSNFVVETLDDYLETPPTHWPTSFRFIYCSLWGRGRFKTDKARWRFSELYGRVAKGGRLILGMYGNQHAKGSAEHLSEREELEATITAIQDLGYRVAGQASSDGGRNNLAAWIVKT